MLGRPADAGGLAGFQQLLAQSGQSLATVQASLAASAEASTAINTLYLDVLGRAADAGGLSLYQQALAQPGSSLGTVQTDLAASLEAAGDIKLIYSQVLGRAADAAGLANWQQFLGETGNTLAAVRSAIAYSPEAQTKVTYLVSGHNPLAPNILVEQMQLADGLSIPNLDLQKALLLFSPTFIVGNGGTLTRTGNTDVFEFGPGDFGQNVVTDFLSSRDILELSHTQFANIGAVLTAETSINGDVQITLDGSNSILLQGVSASQLTPANFHFT